MAEIQELETKVAAAAEKVEKIKATIGKHEAAAEKKLAPLAKFGITLENMEQLKFKPEGGGSEHYWEICEVESKLSDAKGARRKLRDAETILANWQEKLSVEVEKERFLSEQAPAVIVEFLARWKEMARDWHIQSHARYVELKQILKDLKEEAEAEYRKLNPTGRTWGKEYDDFMKGQKELGNTKMAMVMFGGVVARMDTYYNETERLAYLERELEADRKAKLFDLINRVNAVVGTITDASGLDISPKGNLDGIIVGEKGTAEIHTIGAGGYNIQCFHFRTLVHEIKGAAPKAAPKAEESVEEVVTEASGQTALKLEDAKSGSGEGIDGKLGQQLYMNF